MQEAIHSSRPAVVANMACAERLSFAAIGDNVNLAPRLEGINKLYGTEVLMSAATATALADRLPPCARWTRSPSREKYSRWRSLPSAPTPSWRAAETLWLEVLAI
jgi:class 3 adenylate cyclase